MLIIKMFHLSSYSKISIVCNGSQTNRPKQLLFTHTGSEPEVTTYWSEYLVLLLGSKKLMSFFKL